MTMRTPLALACAAVLLSACGGGDDGPPPNPAPLSCSVPDQNAWLRDYMDRTYFWYALAPRPNPALFSTLDAYFDASLFTGNADFPADRFSYYQPTEVFRDFFEGRTLGYGLFVAGVEVEGRPDLPLRVRYIEPRSDAAAQGLLRGDQIVSVNGRLASALIADNDFAVLSPVNVGDTLQLVVRGPGGDRQLALTATDYALTPVTHATVVTSPQGRRMGYVLVKDMIDQVNAPLDTAFRQFRSAGVSEVVLDLRYNGGGYVRTGATVASYIGGNRTSGQDYARLLYSDQQASLNQTFRFSNPSAAAGLSKVYVLSGPRTCSASEQVINGLLGAGVNVVQIGDTTCGKPFGFLSQDNACGSTFSVVNFESVNQRNEGRYVDGLAPTCSVADDLDRPLGSPDEGLLAAAQQHADTGACPATARRAQPLAARAAGKRLTEPGERQSMIVR